MSNLNPTPIIDKNGKPTTVYKKSADSTSPSPRVASIPAPLTPDSLGNFEDYISDDQRVDSLKDAIGEILESYRQDGINGGTISSFSFEFKPDEGEETGQFRNGFASLADPFDGFSTNSISANTDDTANQSLYWDIESAFANFFHSASDITAFQIEDAAEDGWAKGRIEF